MNPTGRMKSLLRLPGRRVDLHEATASGDIAALRVALQSNADVNKQDRSGKAPLHIAVEHGYEAMVKELLSRRADVALQDSDGQTPLHIAALKQYSKIATLLLAAFDHVQDQHKVINARNVNAYTPLMEAARRGNVQLVHTILQMGADPFKVGRDGKNALHLAAQSRKVELVEMLVYEAGMDVNVPVRGTHSRALHYAASKGDVPMVQLLLAAGADPSLKNEHGELAVQLAEEGQHYSVVSEIRKHLRQGQAPSGAGATNGGQGDLEALPHSHQLAGGPAAPPLVTCLRATLTELSIPSPRGPGHASPAASSQSFSAGSTVTSPGGTSRRNWASPVDKSTASTTSRRPQHPTCSVTDYETVVVKPPSDWSPPRPRQPARPAPPQPPPESPGLRSPATPHISSQGPSLSTPLPNSGRSLASAGSAGSTASSSRWMRITAAEDQPVHIPVPDKWSTDDNHLAMPLSLLEALAEAESPPPAPPAPPQQRAPGPQRHAAPQASPRPTPPPPPPPKLAQSLPEHSVAIPPAHAHDFGPLSAGRRPRAAEPGQASASTQPVTPSRPWTGHQQPLPPPAPLANTRQTTPSPPAVDRPQQPPRVLATPSPTTASPEPSLAFAPLGALRPRLPSSTGGTPPTTSPRPLDSPQPTPVDLPHQGRPVAPSRPPTAPSPSPSPSPSAKAPPPDLESRSLMSYAAPEAAAAHAPATSRQLSPSAPDTATQRDVASQLPPSPALPRAVPYAARRATTDLAWEAITGSSSPAEDDDYMPPPDAPPPRRFTTSDLPLRALGQQPPPPDASPPIVQALRAGPVLAPPTSSVPTGMPRHRTVAQLLQQQQQQQGYQQQQVPLPGRPLSAMSSASLAGAASPSGGRRNGPLPALDANKPFQWLLPSKGNKQ